jgi:4-amino-4-deoxy-L-arabinose transferase-like glycosyltransferase
MNPGSQDSKRTLQWLTGACLCGILVLHLHLAATGDACYRDQHLGTALVYAERGVDLLHPVIAGFNATGTPTPLEVPLWQAAAGLAVRWLGGWWGAANLVAWLLFSSCVYPFFRLARDAIGEKAAWWSLLVLLLFPLIVWQAGQAGTDGTALAASIWFVFCASRLVATGSWLWWGATALCGAVAVTQKLPFFMAAGLASIGLVVQGAANSLRRWLQLAAAGGAAAVAFLAWHHYCERQFGLAEFPLVNLRVADGTGMREWYFGSWADRFHVVPWIRGAYRVLTGVFGNFGLVVLAFAGLLQRRQTLARWWLGGAAVTTLVFTNLVLQHWHYYLMLCPAVALACGGALVAATDLLHGKTSMSPHLLTGTAVAVLLLASVQGAHTGNFLMRDHFAPAVAGVVAGHTSEADNLLIAGGGWGGRELLLAKRRGLSIWNAGFLADPAKLARIRALGFTKLVLLSQAHKSAAVAIVGGSQPARRRWQELLSPVVQDWPVVFQNDDVSILAIPPAAGPALRAKP